MLHELQEGVLEIRHRVYFTNVKGHFDKTAECDYKARILFNSCPIFGIFGLGAGGRRAFWDGHGSDARPGFRRHRDSKEC